MKKCFRFLVGLEQCGNYGERVRGTVKLACFKIELALPRTVTFFMPEDVHDSSLEPVQVQVKSGVTNRVRNWENKSPPTTARPSGRLDSEPVPRPMAMGRVPASADMVVIMIGLNRMRHAL